MEKRNRSEFASDYSSRSDYEHRRESIEILHAFQRIAEPQTRSHVVKYVKALANVEAGRTSDQRNGKAPYG